jgi:hypothetical protein
VSFTETIARIPQSRAKEFKERMAALHAEFEALDEEENEEADEYLLAVAFFPLIYYAEDEAQA